MSAGSSSINLPRCLVFATIVVACKGPPARLVAGIADTVVVNNVHPMQMPMHVFDAAASRGSAVGLEWANALTRQPNAYLLLRSPRRRAYSVPEPRVSLVRRQVRCRRSSVHPFQGRHDVPHGPLGPYPSGLDVREVELTVVALLPAGEPDGAPETLDVTQHFRAEGVHAGHPVTVQAPDQVVSHQAGELVAADVHPIRVAVSRQADEQREDRVDAQFRHADENEAGEGGRATAVTQRAMWL